MKFRFIFLALGLAGSLGILAATVGSTRAGAPVADRPSGARQGSASRALLIDNAVVAPWGPGSGQLGHRQPEEGNPEGPMALLVDPTGKILVLDQVNRRLSIFDSQGKPTATVTIPSTTVQDIAFIPSGGFVLLDRLADRSLIFVNDSGVELRRVGIEGKGVGEGGGVTAMVTAPDGVWVEYEHRSMTRIASLEGETDPHRPTVEGRPFGSNMILRAARDPKGIAVISVFSSSMALGSGYLAKVDFGSPISQLLEVSGDSYGRVTIAAHLVQEGPSPAHAVVQESIALAVLSPNGSVERRGEIPAPDLPEEQFRAFTMGPDGSIYHLHMGTSGATIRRAR